MAKKAAPEELDMDQIAEAELVRLQRQLRIMEGDKAAYGLEILSTLQKQRKILKSLEKEKKELLLNIALATSDTNEARDRRDQEEITNLVSLTEKYDQDIKSERVQLFELEWQIRKLEKEVKELRKQDPTDLRYTNFVIKTQHTINNLENRLGVETTRFNAIVAANKLLRQEIEHLLKERCHFNELYKQLKGRLWSGKKVMVDLIEQASLAYDQREEAQNKLHALKERGKQDQIAHSQDMRELQRKLDHDTKLQDFLGVKGQRRIMADLEAKEALKKKQQREQMEQLIESYENILTQIKDFSGEQDIDRLAAQFIKQEEENFALFNYVNELNNELEILQEQVVDLRRKIDEQNALNEERALQQKETIAKLNKTLKEKTEEADQARGNLNSSQEMLQKLLAGIEKMFHLVRCDSAPVLKLLGDNTHVTQYNVMLFLGIIERRTNDLMNVVYYQERKEVEVKGGEEESEVEFAIVDEEPAKPFKIPLEHLVPTNPCPLCAEQEEMAIVDPEEEPMEVPDAEERVIEMINNPEVDLNDRLHNVSACRLPESRKIVQKRYL